MIDNLKITIMLLAHYQSLNLFTKQYYVNVKMHKDNAYYYINCISERRKFSEIMKYSLVFQY